VVTALTTYIDDAQRAGVADAHLTPHERAVAYLDDRTRLYQLVGTADDEEVERQLDSLVEIVWRVVYLSGRGAAGRTNTPPSKRAPGLSGNCIGAEVV